MEVKRIPDHPNYVVSDDGKVYRVRDGKLKELSQDNSKKYPFVKIDKQNCYVHRLVAEAFVPKDRESQNIVSHIDKDKFNNSSRNLIWMNQFECQKTYDWKPDYRIDHLRQSVKNDKFV